MDYFVLPSVKQWEHAECESLSISLSLDNALVLKSSWFYRVVVDIVQSKLDFAKQFAATDTFLPSSPKQGEEKMAASERNAGELLVQLGEDVLKQGGVDLVLECTGAPPCIQMGVFMCKIRGRMVQVGMGPKDVIIPLWRVNIRVS